MRRLLLPFSWIYGSILFLRNRLYDVGIFKQLEIPKKSICVGNLAIGGTGKSPHVSYLIELLKDTTKITILSRGYGRKTKGFILATEHSTGSEIGDEPKMYVHRFHPTVSVVVCEKRVEGVEKIMNLFPDNELIILDDAYQHRAVKAERSLLLTDYNSLYSDDFVLPAGNLREWKIGRKRANWIVVTKCPPTLTETEKSIIRKKLKFNSSDIFFSSIIYGELISFGSKIPTEIKHVLLVTGIANPKPLITELQQRFQVEIMTFPDHHNFTAKDIHQIHQNFDTFATEKKVIITTEKDFMRLSEMSTETEIRNYPWVYQVIDIEIDRKDIFNNSIKQYVDTI